MNTAFLVSLLCLWLTGVSAVPTTAQGFKWNTTKHVIAFGDSYTRITGPLGYPNSSFIGDTEHLAFTSEQLLNNPIIQNLTATAEGGPNWVEFLTGCGLVNDTLPTSCDVQLWDFAFGGADVSTEYTPLHHEYTTSLVNQTAQFIKYGYPALKSIVDPKDTLVAVWIGINDISDSSSYNVSWPEFYDAIITTLFERVQAVRDVGCFDNWLFINLPPLDRTASNLLRTGGPLPSKEMVDLWDSTLARHSTDFEASNRGVKSMVFDANTFLNEVLDNHAAYNITNTTGYCSAYDQPNILTDPGSYGCKPLDQYFWYNSGHMTSHTHKIMTEALMAFLQAESKKSA